MEKGIVSSEIFDCFPDGVIIFDENGLILDANPAACTLYCYDKKTILSFTAAEIIFGKNMALFEQLKAELRFKPVYLNETVDHNGKGEIFNAEIRAVRSGIDGDTRCIVFIRDITDRKKMQETLEYMAHYDILTGLPNRVYFYNRFAHAIAYAKRDLTKIALLFLDIDGFKSVNDEHGHNVGDMVLQGISERLMQCVRESDIVARIGGDELTVVLTKINSRDDVEKIGRKIIELVSSDFRFGDISCNVGVSIGIVIYPDDGKETETLLKKADIAMYQVKDSGKNDLRFYAS